MKKLLMFGLPVLMLLLGGVYLAASLGFLPIPGISPTKYGKPVLATTSPSRSLFANLDAPVVSLGKSIVAEASKPVKSKPVDTPAVNPNAALGDAKLAELWNNLEPSKLVALTAKWQPNNLARVLLKMDSDAVSEYLAALPVPRAQALSAAIQQTASLPPPPTTT